MVADVEELASLQCCELLTVTKAENWILGRLPGHAWRTSRLRQFRGHGLVRNRGVQKVRFPCVGGGGGGLGFTV